MPSPGAIIVREANKHMAIDADSDLTCGHRGRAVDPAGAGSMRWLALVTHPHKEQQALENLQRQGFDAYCPMLLRTVRHARRTQLSHRPLFPGYVFARAAAGKSWKSMNSTTGVRRIVSFGEQPCLLCNDFIVALRAREMDGAIVRPAQPYAVGQKVRLVEGAFDGFVATVVAVDEKLRLILLLDLLNQSVRVRASVHAVREM